MRRNPKVIGVVFGVVGVALLWLLLSRIGIGEILAIVRGVPLWQALAIACFPVVSFAIAAWRLQRVVRLAGESPPPLPALVGFALAGNTVSMALPSATASGETAKALLLRGRAIPGPAAFAAVFWDSFIRFTANTGTTFLVLAVIFASGALAAGPVRSELGVIWGLGSVLAAVVIFRGRLRRGGFFAAAAKRMFGARLDSGEIAEFDRRVSVISAQRFAVAVPLAISLIGYLWEVVQSWLILGFLGIGISLPAVLVWHTAVNFGRVLPAPSGAGFAEGAGVLAAGLFSVSPAAGLAFVILSRIRDLAIIALGLAAFVFERFRRKDSMR